MNFIASSSEESDEYVDEDDEKPVKGKGKAANGATKAPAKTPPTNKKAGQQTAEASKTSVDDKPKPKFKYGHALRLRQTELKGRVS